MGSGQRAAGSEQRAASSRWRRPFSGASGEGLSSVSGLGECEQAKLEDRINDSGRASSSRARPREDGFFFPGAHLALPVESATAVAGF